MRMKIGPNKQTNSKWTSYDKGQKQIHHQTLNVLDHFKVE